MYKSISFNQMPSLSYFLNPPKKRPNLNHYSSQVQQIQLVEVFEK